jgi:acyl carrier protein
VPGADDKPALAGALRGHAAGLLPRHMVPAAITVLDVLPLTAAGDVDRAALPAVGPEGGQFEGGGQATDREQALCALFAQILGLDQVQVHDNFFDLGGHSLLAVRLVSRIRSTLGAEVPVRVLFEAPTPEALAARLGQTGPARLALAARQRPGRVPLSYAQQRLWFVAQMEGPNAAYNLPMAVRLAGDLDVAALAAALADVIGRHEVLRTVFPAADGKPCQRVLAAAELDWELPVTEVSEADLADAVERLAVQPFDLATEIPLRARLLRLAPDSHVLTVVLHHIAGDGWSTAVLAGDISAAYAARHRGQVPGWDPLPAQYADYAIWQRELLGDEDDSASLLARQVDWWRQALAGAPAELALPADRPRPRVPSHRGHRAPLEIPAGLHARLAGLARAHGATLFMVLQAALAVLLSKLGAGNDIPVVTPVAGRTDKALDDLVGFFVNSLVLRTDLSGDPPFVVLLGRVREAGLSALDHQDVPFNRLVEALPSGHSLARQSFSQVVLAIANNVRPELELPGIAASVLPVGITSAVADIHVGVIEDVGEDGAPAGMHGAVLVAEDLFDPGTGKQLARRLVRVLTTVADNPLIRLHEVEVLDDEERQQILVAWNDTAGEP